MKNILNIDNGIPTLLSNVDDGTNTLYINDELVPSSEWTGTGYYTFTSGGLTFTIQKIRDDSGNIMLQLIEQSGGTSYRLIKATSTDDKYYSIYDPAETDLADGDYVPFYDTSAGAKKKSLWSNIVDKIKSVFVQKSGDTMSGSLTFSAANTNAIKYAGTKETYPMIKFKDNANDNYGNGIVIGGGGLVVIGGGESSDSVAATHTSGGDEVLDLASDGNVIVWTNVQNGATSADVKKFTFATDGSLNVPTVLKENGVEFYTGNSGNAEHNANNAVKNGHYYYTSNGPATSLGASTNDGALYVQQYSDSWIGQIAQDYRNGNIFVRGKNNGSWTAWKKVRAEHADSAGSATTADKLAGFSSRSTTMAWGVQTGSVLTCFATPAGGGLGFRDNCPNSGQTSMIIDGRVYQDEGRYMCLDTANYSSYVVPKTGGEFTGDVHINRTSAVLRLYKTASLYCNLTPSTPSSNITVYLPNTGGTLALMSSSRRIKKNIRKITEEEAKKLLDIEVVKFDYKEFWDKDGVNQCGFIAEDVIKIIPETVHIFEDYDPNIPVDAIHNLPPEIDYRKFVPYLVKMVQIQQDEINELKAEIKALKEG